MSTNDALRTAPAPSQATPAPVGVVRATARAMWAFVETILEWEERRRQRLALQALDDHLLRDIGISRVEADGEGRKPFWRG